MPEGIQGPMQWFDYAVLTALGLSLLVGILRGLMREMVSLAGWIAAFVLATAFSGIVSAHMPESLGPMLSGLLAFLLVFIGVLVLSGGVGLALARLGDLERRDLPATLDIRLRPCRDLGRIGVAMFLEPFDESVR